MGDLAGRIINLSPKKRELLLKHLAKEKGHNLQTRIKPRPKDSQSIPLSFAQQRLWFLDQLSPGQVNYNNHLALMLRGELQVSAIERSLNEIIARHEILRTSFLTLNGAPIQVITPRLQLSLPVVDLRERE